MTHIRHGATWEYEQILSRSDFIKIKPSKKVMFRKSTKIEKFKRNDRREG
jgi:hypothetical protein